MRSGRGRRLLVLAAGAAVCAAAAAVALRSGPGEPSRAVVREGSRWRNAEGAFAGSHACRECHSEIHRRQLASAHADSLRALAGREPRAPFGTGQGVVDPDTGARYEMVADGAAHAISVQRAGLEARQRLHYEFGSGRRAFAYLARLGETEFLDSRLNYYQEVRAWDFTSGQEKGMPTLVDQPLGRPLDAGDAALCFSCHTTGLRARPLPEGGAGGDRVRLDLKRTSLGVTCEACHGPRREHVRAHRRGQAGSPPPRMTAAEISAVCARCHTAPEATPNHSGAARFQPLGLSRSRCFQESAGRLSCISCHDPHADSPRDLAYYEARCLSCHAPGPAGGPGRAPCPVNPRSGCVGCHMPRDSRSMLHVTFTDHFIRIRGRSGGAAARGRAQKNLKKLKAGPEGRRTARRKGKLF